tara:strand:+ start:297 stop:623 length:327 start_codon:yes stop_codon:yes gene_type:complete
MKVGYSYNKYKNIPTIVDDIRFASKKEAARYVELKLLEKNNVIRNLELQPRFPCIINGKKVCSYIADFRYFSNNSTIVEDVKGKKTDIYKLKKKLVEALWPGVTITEV